MATFPSIRIEGGLLGPEVLDQLLAAELPGQRPADFGIDGRRNLTDEIAAVFADARALWGLFQHRLTRLPEDDIATTVTRDAWVIPFLGLLGYEPRYNPRAYEVDGLSFAISHRAAEAEDSPPIHIVGARQELGHLPPSGRPRLAPHSLVQEYLNRAEHLWGMVTNGQTLRLLRDSTFVRRQAYVEFDLAAMLEEQRFADFTALYRLLHRTRLPRGAADAPDCLLEKYYDHSVEQGGRVRDHLRDGVEDCIKGLANGFLRHPDNAELRRRVSPECTGNEHISPEELYHQLLRLVYRFLFLLVSEDRGLLSANPLYREHYSIARLRRCADHRAAYTDHDDLWQSLRVLWLVLMNDRTQPALNGQPMASALGLPVLNGELLAPLDLDEMTIANRDLLGAFWYLACYQDRPSQPPRRVNYAALDVEELGSVYESLLEFHPDIAGPPNAPTFDLIVAGGERRSTGSHYTPPELVAPLIKHALEPVLIERLRAARTAQEKERAILSMKVCDPACGSGHFLLAAARRMGKELACVRTGEDEPAPERVREAIRDVITHCIYGVDKNPLAVELCRVALWLESHTGGKPLTFLDHRIRCGDSLVGVFDLGVLTSGIPNEAFKPVGGDNKAIARSLMRENRQERLGRRGLPFDAAAEVAHLSEAQRVLNETPDDTPANIRRKKQAFAELQRLGSRDRTACDLWTAAFFQTLAAGPQTITTDTIRRYLETGTAHGQALGQAVSFAANYRFFHWPIEFPEVFTGGGFDAVIGNPPFLGGLKISSEFGDKYRAFLDAAFHPFENRPDLCAAFFRRGFDTLNERGRSGLIATKTIAQGDTREAGLARIIRCGGFIAFAQRFVAWPGQATVEVNLLAVSKQEPAEVVLDGSRCENISSRLDSEPESHMCSLTQNTGKAFIGCYVHGLGFVLDITEAQEIIARDGRNADCLPLYMTGQDINSDPDPHPTRRVICFHDWSREHAETYPDLFQIVVERAKPERDRLKSKRPRERWWLFEHYAPGLWGAVRPLSRMMVRSRVSETHALIFVPKAWICSEATVVFAFDDHYHFALLQSNVHEAWVRKNASTLRTDIRYTPTDCFDTFAFPQAPAEAARREAEQVGEAYYEHRRQVMLARQLGLTKSYNLFHDPECVDADIARLRDVHAAMDCAILACYGWTDIDPGHGFHQNERGQTRFTVSPTARRDILRRLLALNLELAAREAGNRPSEGVSPR